MRGKWRIKCHLFDQHNGALYPLLEGVGSESGPDEEMWRWIAHKARQRFPYAMNAFMTAGN